MPIGVLIVRKAPARQFCTDVLLRPFLPKCQNSGIGLGRLHICLNDPSLDLSCQRVHPGHLLRSRSPQRRSTRRFLSHRSSHLIAKFDRHVMILRLDIGNINVRTLPPYRECSLPLFRARDNRHQRSGLLPCPSRGVGQPLSCLFLRIS